MSQIPGDPNSGMSGFEPAPTEQMPVEAPRRAASLTLRGEELREMRAASMEAANKSLGDALRITYRLLQVVMVAIAALFVLSGFQQITEGESGVRVTLGRIDGANLDPGFRFSLPYPLGEIVKIQTGQRRMELSESFWFYVDASNRGKPLDKLGFGSTSLPPGKDNSLLTADGNIAHAKLAIVYRRDNPSDFLAHVNTDAEEAIVRGVIERATVRVISTATIEDLLKRSSEAGSAGAPVAAAPSRESGLESRIRRAAQDALDALKSGLVIDQVVISDATPPLRVRGDFAKVQSVVTAAETERQKAEQERTRTLNEVAGSAYKPLLDLIDAYERAIELGKPTDADAVLATIFEVFDGKLDGANAPINGVKYPDVRISGDVARSLSAATEYRSSVVARAQAAAATFRAKREQYLANPKVFLTTEWADAMRMYLRRDNVQVFQVPEGTGPLAYRLSPDPKIARDQEAAQKAREIQENWQRREAAQAESPSRQKTDQDEIQRQKDAERDEEQ
jgi:regulator of protease activity HflC (stomatin/prohibitin superfamily)